MDQAMTCTEKFTYNGGTCTYAPQAMPLS